MAAELLDSAQANPTAGTLTTLYAVPVGRQAVVSSLYICNRGTEDTTFRISVARGAAADTEAQYLYYDTEVRGNRTFVATVGLALAASAVLRCYSPNGRLSFSAFYTEVDN